MLRFNIARLANNAAIGSGKPTRLKGSTVKLPRLEETAGGIVSYRTALRTLLRGVAKEVRETIIPLAAAEIAAKRAETRLQRDMSREELERLEVIGKSLVDAASALVGRILGLEAKRHSARFMRQARQTLGIDLATVIQDEDLEDYLRTAAARNASLIRNLSEDAVKRVSLAVTTATINGDPVAKLRKKLTREFKILDSRARLIATDQMAKINSDLNMIRHTQAGIKEYDWWTSQDERVRPEHQRLHGKRFAYGKPTTEKDGLRPGQPIRCRCTAIALVQF